LPEGLFGALLLVLTVLGGCASPIHWQRPGATAQDLEQAKAACRMVARGLPPATGQSTEGGNALTSMAAMQEQYQDCMVASGWTANNL
jgi:hypothetical protein